MKRSTISTITALALASTTASAEFSDGLVEYWTLDGNYDAGITPEHAGTLLAKGAGLAESGFAQGKFGQAIDLESSDTSNQASVVVGGDENDFDFEGGSMSLSVWYTTESLYRDWQCLIGKGEGGAWRLARNRTNGSQLKISLWLVGNGNLDQQDGSWHHAAVVISPDGHFLYVDGELSASNTDPGNIGGSGLPMHIGGNPQAADRGWDGMIDDVAVWNRPLTADEVAAIWNGGTGASITDLLGIAPDAPNLNITRNGSNLDLDWESQPAMLYNLFSSEDLVQWSLVEANIEATPDTNTKTIPRPAGPSLFYRVEEFPKPPVVIYSENFDATAALPEGWTSGANPNDTGGTTWQVGAPASPGPATASSPPHCVATNLASDYTKSTDIWLRTPATIDLTTATAAELSFRHWISMDAVDLGDTGTIRVLDTAGLPGTVTELAVVKADIQGSHDWIDFSAPIPQAALGKTVALEFRVVTDTIDFAPKTGWYIDDINVSAVQP